MSCVTAFFFLFQWTPVEDKPPWRTVICLTRSYRALNNVSSSCDWGEDILINNRDRFMDIWQDACTVLLLLSTMHTDKIVANKRHKTKPKAVFEDKCKVGVDMSDQIGSKHGMPRLIIYWYRKLTFLLEGKLPLKC